MSLSNGSSFGWYLYPENQSSHTVRKIRAFRRLKQGWHYGEGDPIEEAVIHRAVAFHNYAERLGFHETDAFPTIDGGIDLAIYMMPTHFEFLFLPDGTVEYRREVGDTIKADEENLTDDAAQERLKNFGHEEWTQFVSSTSNIMTSSWDDSDQAPSEITGQAFPFLMSNAS